jgi:hypothetical protein
MSPLLRRLGWSSAVSTLFALSACTLASPTYITAQEESASDDDSDAGTGKKTLEGEKTPGKSSSDPAASTCDAKMVKVDLSKLTACQGGKGHCYPKGKAGIFAAKYIACAAASDVCVPDEVLQAGGGKLKTCKSVSGLAGACFTATLMPEIIARGGSALPRDVCDADQLCLPCTDPLSNNAPTGMCAAIGVSAESCDGANAGGASGTNGSATTTPAPAPSPPCCTTSGRSSGICIAEAAIPAAQRGDTKQDVCASANKCVPKAFVENKPVKCSAGILGSGVCLDKCFDDMMSTASEFGLLSRSTCASTEVCVPCLFGKDKGMPGCN